MRGAHDDVESLDHPERLERRTRAFARIGGLIPDSVIERSLASESQLSARINSVLEDHDFLVTPAVARTAPPIGALQGRGALTTLNAVAGWVPYNGIWNLTGQPALSLPAGLSAEGLPLAVQIVSRAGAEGPLLALAAQLEAARPWAEQIPPGFA
jgi:amidase